MRFVDSFPFKFTSAQKRVIREIREDMQKTTPMLRLLQGDVGSGKTVVAVFGCFSAFLNGYQSCIMAPTEILARQHYEKIKAMIETGSLKDIRVRLLVSTTGLSVSCMVFVRVLISPTASTVACKLLT